MPTKLVKNNTVIRSFGRRVAATTLEWFQRGRVTAQPQVHTDAGGPASSTSDEHLETSTANVARTDMSVRNIMHQTLEIALRKMHERAVIAALEIDVPAILETVVHHRR